MTADDSYRRLAGRLREEVPGEIVDLYESYLNEVEERLALEELFDALEAAGATISAQSAELLWDLAKSWGITRFTQDEVAALARTS
jgi:hypothetical protein